MEFDNRRNSLDRISDQMWKANNYRKNGVIDKMKASKEQFNRMNNIKSKEDQRKEILHASSVEGRLERLNQQMNAVKNLNNHKF